jgi:TfoX/Sxy family transcriptional regulator of competence genes
MDRAQVDALAAHLSVFGSVRVKPMFGAWLAYVDEVPAAILGRGELYLKLGALSTSEVVALCGNAAQPYDGSKGYARVDPACFANPDWVAQVKAARAAAPARKPAKKPARPRKLLS